MQGVLKLKNKAMADDTHPIDRTCECMVWCSFSFEVKVELSLSDFRIILNFPIVSAGVQKLLEGIPSLPCH